MRRYHEFRIVPCSLFPFPFPAFLTPLPSECCEPAPLETEMKASATYTVKKWEEKPYDDISSEMKMTRASVEYALDGEIKGKAAVQYLMFYSHSDAPDQPKPAAGYVGLVRLDGAVGGKSGSSVMQDPGSFEQGTASSALQIVEHSATGELKGI